MAALALRTLAIIPLAFSSLFVRIITCLSDWKCGLSAGLMSDLQGAHSHGTERNEQILQEQGNLLLTFRWQTWMTSSEIVLTISSSGIFVLKSLETGHWSLGSLRKSGPFCHVVSFSTSLVLQLVLVGKSSGFKLPEICWRGS